MFATNVAPVDSFYYVWQQYLVVLATTLILFLDFLKVFYNFSQIKKSRAFLSLSVLNFSSDCDKETYG
jgi:hypothetical protein